MYLLGTTLTKLLATVAAIMTVTAGVPSFECRCPDGRLMPFCQGAASSPSGCCCVAGCSSSPEAKSSCHEAKKANAQGPKAAKKRSCCTHSQGEPQNGPGGDGPQLAPKAACCVKTVGTAPAVSSLENTGVPVHQSGDTLALWQPALVPPHAAPGAMSARSPPSVLTASPDLVVVLCRFTC